MRPTHPLELLLFAFGLAGALLAAVAGKIPLAVLLAGAPLTALGRRTVYHSARCHRRPTITCLPAPLADEPLIRLDRGQTATVPRPHPLQDPPPEGTRLQILEATPERIRVIAV